MPFGIPMHTNACSVVPIGISMLNPVKLCCCKPCADRHCYTEPSEIRRSATLRFPVPFGITIDTNTWSVVPIDINMQNYSVAISSVNWLCIHYARKLLGRTAKLQLIYN